MQSQISHTIFITTFHALAARNILGTDVLETLTKIKGLQIVIFVPDYKRQFYIENYQKENIIIEGINEGALIQNPWFKLFRWITFFLIPTFTIAKLRAQEKLYKYKNLKSLFEYLASRIILLCSRSHAVHRGIRHLDTLLSKYKFLKPYLKIYRPAYLFATDVLHDTDVVFMQAAKHYKLRTIGMVRSWDNLTTRGLMRVIPETLIVNNEVLKEEAIVFQDIDPETIFVGGVPQFDRVIQAQPIPRENFFRKIGADPTKRLILFAPAGYILSDTDWQILEILKLGLDQHRIPADLQFLVRSHPGDPAPLEKFKPDQRFIIERPGVYFEKSLKVTELRREDAMHLVDSLYHCELIIHISSTIGLDSLPFDKPQIMIGFDGWEKKTLIGSVRRYHQEDHMSRYLRTGAARVVNNPEELFSWINKYLKDPSIDRENRKQAAQEQLWNLAGKSGERIGNFILSHL